MWHERAANASAIDCRTAAKAFTRMLKTAAAAGEMHSSFATASSLDPNLMLEKI
jgi:hypothetical protein